MSFKAQNTISGKEGGLFIDGLEVAEVKTCEANIEKNKAEVNVMGRRMTGSKTTGAKGSGTLTLYKVTSRFVKMMLDYVKTGKDPYFTVQTYIADASSGRGTERITLLDVNIDSAKIVGLDVDSEALEEEIPFTFEDFDVPESLRSDFN
ncbi:TPA: phage tail tube protein [Listeria monocytogenes]|uniref:Lin1279 protein n=1 Tax=Listeria innocua serovar 6a (strain ATCC BAA-680 / CLIP 11262) TaxID=272626 RepID=Q92CB0_LISIN|nr:MULTISPECIES: phage tail tube protein [Listeria]EAD0695526.1 phage portal protein [Listeria monocytogenes]EAE5608376.1 phage portal protein [Listeria monocytogenes]EAE9977155.1 phage portal protein [Listeria monocytogenes]EAE9987783.1 phage portal protein [Listeria monocytogenes]EAE9989469.1 phage portal protein [Listeria monocytogenes]